MAYINFFKMYKSEAFDTVRLCNPFLRLLCGRRIGLVQVLAPSQEGIQGRDVGRGQQTSKIYLREK